MFQLDQGKLLLKLDDGADLKPEQVAEILQITTRRKFPRLKNIAVTINFNEEELKALKPQMDAERQGREEEIAATTEETMTKFYSCAGCSQFAPDHMCVITPERPPMCGRPYEAIKTGALYGYDDTSNIHHTEMYRDMNAFLVFDKGELIDAERGEWSGANEQIQTLTKGRTQRVFLHSIDDFPHTGCGCFRMIIFRTTEPKPGIGIMERDYKGKAPDGRSWPDLYYNQTGKQQPGSAGCSPAYLQSPKFLQADGGWDNVVWVSPRIAAIMKDRLPAHVEVGEEI